MQRIKPEFWVKALILGLMIFIFIFIYVLNPVFFSNLWTVLTSGNIDDTIAYISSYGVWAIVFSFFLDILVNALGFLPSIFISTANGVIFGIIPGIVISWLAETTGVILSFLLMRSVLRSTAEKIIAKSNYLQKLDEFSGKNGFKMMLIARSMPYFPSGIITAVGALSQMSLRDYILANLIGKLPSTALEVVIGHDIVNYEKNLGRLSIIIAIAVIAYLGVWWYKKRKLESKF